jgi:hypothetical protein
MCITNYALYQDVEDTLGYLVLDSGEDLFPMVTPCKECSYMLELQRTDGSCGYLAVNELTGYYVSFHRYNAEVMNYEDIKLCLHSLIPAHRIRAYKLKLVVWL